MLIHAERALCATRDAFTLRRIPPKHASGPENTSLQTDTKHREIASHTKLKNRWTSFEMEEKRPEKFPGMFRVGSFSLSLSLSLSSEMTTGLCFLPSR